MAGMAGNLWDYADSKREVAPKYGNDDPYADAVGREVVDIFTAAVSRHAEAYRSLCRFPPGVGTFSWYIGIGEGLGASPDGRLSGEPVSSNFSPALGRDRNGIPGAILSYAGMHSHNLPAGGPLDLRLSRRLVEGDEGIARMAALLRGFVETGGSMMTLTVVDAEELRAAQREPERYRSLRVRLAGHDVQVRVPLIPGITDTEENLEQTFAFMRRASLPSAALLPYNPAAGAKYEWLSLSYEVHGAPQSPEHLAGLLAMAYEAGVEACLG